MSASANITYANGAAAAVNATSGSTYYVDPGSALTFALQSSTGVAQWVLTVQSDYAPINGWTYTTSTNFSNPQPFATPLTPCKITLVSEVTDGNNVTQTTQYFLSYPRATQPDRQVRGVVFANVNLTAANLLGTQGAPGTGTNMNCDGVSYVVGDRVLLVSQATFAQNGPYVINTNVNNVATLVRPADWVTGQVVLAPQVFEVSEGVTFANSSWKDEASGAITVDTTNINLYPKMYKGTVTNAGANGLIANLFIASNAFCVAADIQSAAATKTGTINAGLGNGNVTFTCANAADNIAYMVVNW